MRRRVVFHGWWMVAACLLIATLSNAFVLFGAGVYLHTIVQVRGWTTGSVGAAATVLHLLSALLLIPVGSLIQRFGPRPLVPTGGIALALGLLLVGRAAELWQVYAAFVALGVGFACLSMPAIATMLAPWFERHQGRAVSIASIGASAGGILGPAGLLAGIERFSFATTTAIAAAGSLAILVLLSWFVLRHRPEDLGAHPDGSSVPVMVDAEATRWDRSTAWRTGGFRTVVVAFALAMLVQIGFVTHQVALIEPLLGVGLTSVTVAGGAVAALIGRIALARFADQIDLRRFAAGIFLLASVALLALAYLATTPAIVASNLVIGFTVGNVTTLSPMIVRREFGARSFGVVYGTAAGTIMCAAAFGPGVYGALHDALGGYAPALTAAAVFDLVAMVTILRGRRAPATHLAPRARR